MLTPDSAILVSSHVHAREFDGELVILDLAGGQYFGLDPLGSQVWRRVVEGRTLRQVAEEVHGDYDIDVVTLMNDLVSLGNEWIRRGLVQLESEQ